MGSELLLPSTLLVMGFLLLGLEIIVLPGVGLVGLLGIFSLGAGSWILWTDVGQLAGMGAMAASLLATVMGVHLFLKSRAASSLVLEETIEGIATETEMLAEFVGRVGAASGPLRPSGVVIVDGNRLDAVLQDGTYLDAGAAVEVVGQAHGQIHVVAASGHENSDKENENE